MSAPAGQPGLREEAGQAMGEAIIRPGRALERLIPPTATEEQGQGR